MLSNNAKYRRTRNYNTTPVATPMALPMGRQKAEEEGCERSAAALRHGQTLGKRREESDEHCHDPLSVCQKSRHQASTAIEKRKLQFSGNKAASGHLLRWGFSCIGCTRDPQTRRQPCKPRPPTINEAVLQAGQAAHLFTSLSLVCTLIENVGGPVQSPPASTAQHIRAR